MKSFVNIKNLLLAVAVFWPLTVFSQTDSLPAVKVRAEKTSPSLPSRASAQGDTVKILDAEPGLHFQTGGGISSLPVLHGLSSDRVHIKVDGTGITASCPNHMNPALSYVTAAQVAEVQALPGITPVSMGGDSLAGTILVKTHLLDFSGPGASSSTARLSSLYGSNEDYLNLSGRVSFANESNAIAYDGTEEKARDYRDGQGEVVVRTLYHQDNHSLTYARKMEDGVLSLKFNYADVPQQGFVNQAMDLLGNRSNRYSVHYEGVMSGRKTEVSASHQEVDHYMDFLPEYFTGTMPMYTQARETGVSLKTDLHTTSASELSAGIEVQLYRLNDWWPPVEGSMMMSPDTFWNINNGERDRYAVFLEEERRWTEDYSTNLGARIDVVQMNTGTVQGYNRTGNSPMDEAYFNSLERRKVDVNYDMTWLNEHRLSDTQTVKWGLGRKTRSPNLYERYTWGGLQSDLATNGGARMDMLMINWFGDGNGYVGNVGLKPEVSHTVSVSYRYQTDQVGIEVTPYYSEIEDYIDADLKYTSTNLMDNGINYLQFANHDAVIYGLDFSGRLNLANSAFWGEWDLKAVASLTRGYRKDRVSDLHNQMPLNGKLILGHQRSRWHNQFTLTLVAPKDVVSSLRAENITAGYALADLGTGFDWGGGFNSVFQVLNMFDTRYDLPLGGKNLLNNRSQVAGRGRSFVLGFTYDL